MAIKETKLKILAARNKIACYYIIIIVGRLLWKGVRREGEWGKRRGLKKDTIELY